MKKFPHILLVLVVLFAAASSARSQEPISDEKRKLIAELVTLFKMDTQMSEITDTVLKGMETTYPVSFAAAIDRSTSLTPEQKDKLKATESERFRSFSQKFRKRLAESIDYPKYIQETVYPLYDKLYSEQELKDLVAFYRTPTGQKLITTLPQLFAESQEAARVKLLPQILPIIEQLVDEEFKDLAPKSQAGPPPAAMPVGN
jgi:hypothetical protein